MEKIAKYVSSIDWWFTVLIMGIIVNVVAYYLRKYISSGLAKISSTYSNYKTKRDAEIEEESDFLSKNPQLLICVMIRKETGAILFLGILYACFFCSVLLGIMKTYVAKGIPPVFVFFPIGLAIVIQIVCISFLKDDEIIKKALRKLRKQIRMEQTTPPNNQKEGNEIV